MQRCSPAIVQLRARQHRSALTDTEELLWQHIRGRRLGVWFRSQVPLGRFIVDFLAPSARLIVEVDGGYHAARDVADRRRDEQLVRLGYCTLRIEAALVRRNLPAALDLIRAALDHPARGSARQSAPGRRSPPTKASSSARAQARCAP